MQMKILKYNTRTRVNLGTDIAPVWEEIITPVEMAWNAANEKIAMLESIDGSVSIEDDGADQIPEPTQLDRIESQLMYTAMMTDTLLEV